MLEHKLTPPLYSSRDCPKPITIAVRYGHSIAAGIAGSNLAEGMNVRLLCCVGRGLCDGLITRSEEFY